MKGPSLFVPLWLLAMAACIPFPAFPQQEPFEAGVGIVYAEGHAFLLKAPEGWILDRESRGKTRREPVFYPVGFTAKDTPVLIWAGSQRAEPGGRGRIETLLEEKRRSLAPPLGSGAKSIRVAEWRVGKGLHADVFAFVSDPKEDSLLESMACIRTAVSIDYVVVKAKDESFYGRSLAAFASIVKSYIPFQGGTVYIPR
ncbi:hypothetical protein MAMC_02225 [Methylacidimicrobium cyclopophantes]|uniref:Uncharacterized protein n=1 Tax=Methylacidimicrobium cyclopophantes TaxID=1041766 RepID=A0A5E6MGA0_9BACT|nr:hypothetical protein [Methylacidimicrobium cyclopophantes]VVM08510.1 hypothetical protein MAMC_02225 [Methylacidimicrobium cyclopophantes]